MTESKMKRTRRAAKPALKVKGILTMPEDIFPWEIDLLGPILGAIQKTSSKHTHSDSGIKEDGR